MQFITRRVDNRVSPGEWVTVALPLKEMEWFEIVRQETNGDIIVKHNGDGEDQTLKSDTVMRLDRDSVLMIGSRQEWLEELENRAKRAATK